MPQTRETSPFARRVGVPYIIVFLNKCDMVDDEELLEPSKWKSVTFLSNYDFPGDTLPIVKGSAKLALEGDQSPIGEPASLALADQLDSYIPTPERAVDQPFLMPIEDVFSISGRGTVVTGRVERGVIRVGDEIEIVGVSRRRRRPARASVFRSSWTKAKPTTTSVSFSVGAPKRRRRTARFSPSRVRSPRTPLQGRSLRPDEEGHGRHRSSKGYRPQFYFRTTDVTGTIELPEGVEMVMPGDNIQMTVKLICPIAMEQGLRFAIREGVTPSALAWFFAVIE